MTPREQMRQLLTDAQFILDMSDDPILNENEVQLLTMALQGITEQTEELQMLAIDEKPKEKLPLRKCNLCPKQFKPVTKFQRFCSHCKSRAKREYENPYNFTSK